MKRAATLAAAAMLSAVFVSEGACLAANNGKPEGPGAILGALAGTAVSTAELGRQQARGVPVENAISDGTVKANSVGSGSLTGTIANTNSINNNVGITTVFQNSGNNSLFQSSTSIFISIH